MKIRLCQHNQGAAQRLQRVQEEYPDADCKLKKCAKQCKICKQQPFVLLNKQRLQAESEELLWNMMVDVIKQSL